MLRTLLQHLGQKPSPCSTAANLFPLPGGNRSPEAAARPLPSVSLHIYCLCLNEKNLKPLEDIESSDLGLEDSTTESGLFSPCTYGHLSYDKEARMEVGKTLFNKWCWEILTAL